MEYEYKSPEYNAWWDKAEAAKKELLNQAVMRVEDLYLILNRKLNLNLKWEQEIKNYRDGDTLIISSEDIPMEYVGICKFLFTRINLQTFNSAVGVEKDPNDRGYHGSYDMEKEPIPYLWMTIDFRYEHTGGGHNGHDFATCWFKNGTWEVEFVDSRERITSAKVSTRDKNTKALISALNKMF